MSKLSPVALNDKVRYFDRVQESIDLICVNIENKKGTKYIRELIFQQARIISNEFQLPEDRETAIEDALNVIYDQVNP